MDIVFETGYPLLSKLKRWHGLLTTSWAG